jgi:hypothetical protein
MGLWGVPNRQIAWTCCGLSIVVSLASIGYGMVKPIAFLGGFFAIAAAWYYLTIRWVNKHDGWR